VWTGSKMIVWGGETGVNMPTNTGGVYDPATDAWTPTSMTGAPAVRHSHVAVWTGSKMLVWGGFGAMNLETVGGIYDPATDSWSPMSTMNQPPIRTFQTVVWTGKKMVIWGGRVGSTSQATGGMYDPATDTWSVVNQAGAPSARFSHRAAWSGSSMLVWGGQNLSDWLSTGAYFDPEGTPTGVWTSTTPPTGVPEARKRPTVEFLGQSFVVWGGWNGGVTLDTGAQLDPQKNAWTEMSKTDAPDARTNHMSIAAGDHVLVWGGCSENLCEASQVLGDGGQFVPTSTGGAWFPVEAQAALTARHSATVVYTGSSVIVWGGRLDPQTRTNTGARAPL
jgi:hypothetical protein